MRHPIRRALPAVLVVAATGALAACGQAEEPPTDLSTLEASPSPSPSESLSKEEQAQQKDVDAAWAMLQEYLALENEVANDGFKDSDKLVPYLGTGPIAEDVIDGYRQMVDLGYTSEGETKYTLLESSDYSASNDGSRQVSLETCVDTTSSQFYDADGNEVDAESPDRYVSTWTLRKSDGSEYWLIVKDEPDYKTTC